MKKQKTTLKTFLFILAFYPLFLSCEDEEKETKLGKQAAIEFGSCYKNNSMNECLKRLKSTHSQSEYTSDYFITSFI